MFLEYQLDWIKIVDLLLIVKFLASANTFCTPSTTRTTTTTTATTATTATTSLPPCPLELIDLRTREELIPGLTCISLPPCPIKTKGDLSGEEILGEIINIRKGVELIPGETCQPLPTCPIKSTI